MGDPSAQQAAPAQTYKVERGDSLSAIARRFGVSVAEIKTANNLSTDTIKVGQELLIPGAGVAAASFVVEGETSEYVVATGDSLSVIARRFGVSVAAIKAANNLSGDTIRIGQKLVIPAAGQVVPSAAPAPAPKAPAPAISGQTYTVQEGETLGGIANRAGVKVQDLMAVNNITDPRKLRVGQVLQIPVGGRVPAAALAPSAPAVAPRPAVVEEAPAPIRVEPAATVPASGGAEDLEMLDDEPATPTVPVQGDDSGSELP
jgi:LysM repeat protein